MREREEARRSPCLQPDQPTGVRFPLLRWMWGLSGWRCQHKYHEPSCFAYKTHRRWNSEPSNTDIREVPAVTQQGGCWSCRSAVVRERLGLGHMTAVALCTPHLVSAPLPFIVLVPLSLSPSPRIALGSRGSRVSPCGSHGSSTLSLVTMAPRPPHRALCLPLSMPSQ